jgi:hypothetical protein
MADYNKSGPGHPPRTTIIDADPVAIAMLRALVVEMDAAYIHASANPTYMMLYLLYKEQVIKLARMI